MFGGSDAMTDHATEPGFVVGSNYRVTVLRRLEGGPATPSQIAEEDDIAITHVSGALTELRDLDLVTLLVPEDRRKGRVYGITEKGGRIWDVIETRNLVE